MVLKCTVREPVWPPTSPDETVVYEKCKKCGVEMTTHHAGYWYKAKPHSMLDDELCVECEDEGTELK